MKKVLMAFLLLVLNVSCTCIIGILRLQDYLSMIIYFLPSIVIFIISVLLCKKDYICIRSILLRLLLMLILLIFILCFAIYLSGNFLTSIVAVCIFATTFNIIPLLMFFILSYFLKKNKQNENDHLS